jgi:hypothetical protein
MCTFMTTRQVAAAIVATLLCHAPSPAQETDPDPYDNIFTSERWCDDSGTACWRSPRDGDWFNGVRFIAEFDLRFVFQRGTSRFEVAGLQALPKLAVEFNIYKSWAAFQLAITAPGTITLDSASRAALSVAQEDGQVRTDIGFTAGFSFLDSSIAVGMGRLHYDLRGVRPSCTREEGAIYRERERRRRGELQQIEGELRNAPGEAALDTLAVRARDVAATLRSERIDRPCVLLTERGDSFGFIALQPVSTLRSNLKNPRRD